MTCAKFTPARGAARSHAEKKGEDLPAKLLHPVVSDLQSVARTSAVVKRPCFAA
jgi:hypothetical protein